MHILSLGRFLTLNIGEGTSAGQVATLKSRPLLPLSSFESQRCFFFYFHLRGEDLGTLEVILENLDTFDQTVIWRLATFDSLQEWNAAVVTFDGDVFGSRYKILLRATVGNGREGDFSIDDVGMEDYICGSECISVQGNLHHYGS